MPLIATTQALADLCARLSAEPFICVDTEFLREKTYYPQLCLVQLGGAQETAAIDPLADGLDLAPLFALMDNPQVLKVFHAARQDIEIFVNLSGRVPHPIFDTQVAAMVLGHGDQVGYEALAQRLAKARIDKSHRFTDWSLRPLSNAQLQYALADVTHLRPIYEKLSADLAARGRAAWLDDEMAVLTDPNTYRIDPETVWMRLKPRTTSAKFLAVLQAIAAWREREAQGRDLPRGRVLKDEALLEVAALQPRSPADLGRARSISKGFAEGAMGEGLLAAVNAGLACPPHLAPKLPERAEPPPGKAALIELLKVLLRAKCESEGVAPRLVANSGDLESLAAAPTPQHPLAQGWRGTLFGTDALALCSGRLALAADGDRIRLVAL